MSTDIGTVKGRIQSESGHYFPIYADKNLKVTSFWDSWNGTMIQLTISGGGYIQLTRKQAYKLRKLIKKAYQ